MDLELAEPCRICGNQTSYAFQHNVLAKHPVKYFFCSECGYTQTERPYWLTEAYAEAINQFDTGILDRNTRMASLVASIIRTALNPKGQFLDFAGGYGIFTRLMRDRGFQFLWKDPYCKNLVARGFEADPKVQKFEAITAFEAAEHAEDPIQFFAELTQKSDVIIFSTVLNTESKAPASDWWYYGFEHGQHIGFFQYRTLLKVGEQLGYQLYSNKIDLHIFSRLDLKFKGPTFTQYLKYSLRQVKKIINMIRYKAGRDSASVFNFSTDLDQLLTPDSKENYCFTDMKMLEAKVINSRPAPAKSH